MAMVTLSIRKTNLANNSILAGDVSFHQPILLCSFFGLVNFAKLFSFRLLTFVCMTPHIKKLNCHFTRHCPSFFKIGIHIIQLTFVQQLLSLLPLRHILVQNSDKLRTMTFDFQMCQLVQDYIFKTLYRLLRQLKISQIFCVFVLQVPHLVVIYLLCQPLQ